MCESCALLMYIGPLVLHSCSPEGTVLPARLSVVAFQ